MNFPELTSGRFVRRDNRFRATVLVGGLEAWAHVANSGRLEELFTPGQKVWLAPAASPERKTAYDLKLVEVNDVVVSADARLPNPLFAEAVEAGRLAGFRFPHVHREVPFGSSRIDFRLSGPDGACWVETKSVTLVEERRALFPDAPTSRGRRHVVELMLAIDQGDRAAVVFIVQRPDADRFSPHQAADPAFVTALRQAIVAGVEVRAFTCQVSHQSISLVREIPVDLD